MTFAIIQQTLDPPPTAEQLARAFATLPGMLPYDGAARAKEPFGILANNLPSDHAAALQKSLHAQGVETLIADDASLPVLPPPRLLTRADPLAESLILYDPLGRSQQTPWSDVLLIAAGMVTLLNFKRTHPNFVVVGTGGRYGAPVVVRDFKVEEQHIPSMLVEVLLAGGQRYRILPKQFNYSYLGASVSQRSSDNFLTLIRDLLRFAAGAIRNRGAAKLAADSPRIMPYPSRHAFEEEITWCLWMEGRAAPGDT